MGMEKIEKKMILKEPNKKIKELLIQAQNAHRDNHLEDLEKILKEIVLIDPNYFPAIFNLGKLSEKLKKYEKAVQFYKKTIEINPKYFDAILSLIICYEDMGKLDLAIKISEDSCKSHPDRYEAYYTLGRLKYKNQTNFDDAYNAFKKTLLLNDNFEHAKLSLGRVCKTLGNFLEAKEIFQEFIDSDKNKKIEAYFEIADFLDYKEIKKNIKNLEILEKNNKQTDQEKILLYFAMGKMFEKIKNYKKSIHYYNLGNNLKRKNHEYSIDYDTKRFNALKKTIDKFVTKKKHQIGYKSEMPVFIVGMPRSGTTLLEQIVSSHSKVFGGGELYFFSDFSKKNKNPEKNLIETLDNLEKKDFFDIGKKYIDKIKEISKTNKYFTNKLPGNFVNIGLIKLCLPNAKIIHIKRNSLDTCFSCYKTLFSLGNLFSYSLGELGSFYKLYQKQMNYYKKVFGKEILNINYEELVANSEKEIKKILKYLDLDFEKTCLKFYESKKPVYSKPIYKDSINHWKNYKNFLKPLTDKINF